MSSLLSPKVALRQLLSPYPVPPFVPNQLYSKADALAEKSGVAMVEQLFSSSKAVQALACIHISLWKDREAERALKKDVHGIIEERARSIALRLDPPTAYGFSDIALSELSHPLDPIIHAELAKLDPLFAQPIEFKMPRYAKIRLLLNVALSGFYAVANAIRIAILDGAPRVKRINTRLAAPNFGDVALWRGIQAAAEEQGASGETDILIVRERDGIDYVPRDGIRIVDIRDMRVPVGPWMRHVLIPTLSHAISIMLRAVTRPGDVSMLVVTNIALRQSLQAQRAWRIALNVSFEHYLDNVEYTALHIIKGMVYRKFGGHIVRWSNSDMDSFGLALSYLGYDVFFAAGPYLGETFGATWRPTCRVIPIGHVKKDHRLSNSVEKAAALYRDDIERRLTHGSKMIVFFGPSKIPGVDAVVCNLIAEIVEVVNKRDDCFLVIKPKLSDDMWSFVYADPRLKAIDHNPNVVCVHYAKAGSELCPASWLMHKMTCGVGGIGTTLTEALALEVPYLTYFPVVAETPRMEKLKKYGVLHDNLEGFTNALDAFLDSPGTDPTMFEWFRNQFDCFHDDRALTRFCEAIFSPPSAPVSEASQADVQARAVPITR